jgi:OOP family OmpA-OmpF porin
MKKAIALVLLGLAAAPGLLGCQPGEATPAQPHAPTPTAVPLEATTTQGSKVLFPGGDISWADRIVSFTPGDPAPGRSRDPGAAPGKPDYRGVDDAEDEATYVSLGHGGELVLEFTDNLLVDGEGPDLAIFEIGPEIEPMLVAVGEDGQSEMIDVGRVEGSICSVDIGPFVQPGGRFRLVRLTDAGAGKSNDSQWPGADVDAVGAINTVPVLPAETTE